MNLVEGLTEEILRVTEIVREYKQLPNGSGIFAAILMEESLRIAKEAQASGDIVAMMAALMDLKEFEM